MRRFRMPVTVHVFFRREGRILLLRRRNTGYEDGNYSVPAGHLDGGETVVEAATREAREECGVEIDAVTVAGTMHRRYRDDERVDFFVHAGAWRGEIRNAEPEKCDDLRFFPEDGLPANVIPYVRAALAAARQEPWFLSYGWPDGER